MKVEYLLGKRWNCYNNAGQMIRSIGTRLPIDIFVEDSFLRSIVGKFCVIIENKNEIYIICDSIRSYPIFFSISHTDDVLIYISDNASKIAELIHAALDEENVKEFYKASYVTETETLYEGIYTLNPGTVVRIDKRTGEYTEHEYINFNYNTLVLNDADMNQLIQEFDECLLEVFSDYMKIFGDRTVLTPLSGGCDSRTAVVMLYRLGYSKVKIFSYGRRGNFESERAKIIADNLGFEFHNTEYTKNTWIRLRKERENKKSPYERFIKYSTRGGGIGNIQALPALIDVKRSEFVNDDTVIVPGHALDMVMGSHLAADIPLFTRQELIDRIIDKNYILKDRQKENGNIEKWTSKIQNACNPVNEYMKWGYRNRQSKFIANDARTYEFLGYDYEFPFWDSRIIDFCSKLPFELLLNRKFQYEYTRQKVDPIAGISIGYNHPTYLDNSTCVVAKNKVKKVIKNSVIVDIALRNRKIKGKIYSDLHAWYSSLSDEEYKLYYDKFGKGFNVNSVLSDDYINMLNFSSNLSKN